MGGAKAAMVLGWKITYRFLEIVFTGVRVLGT